MWIAERPGKVENERGDVLVGPTGVEWDETYLRLAGLDRHEQRATNCVKCWALNNRTPSDREVDSCARHFLPDELAECRPEIVVLMGGRACRIADRHLKIDTHHGMPYVGSILQNEWHGVIWPMYHPALGMHDTSKMSQLLEDFEKLGLWLEGKWTPPVDPSVGTELDYRIARDHHDLYEYLDRCPYATPEVGTDTENHGPKPYSLQISHTPGTGRMILAEDTQLLKEYNEYARTAMSIFHFAQHDLDVGAQMGLEFPQYRDTLQEAYHQCSLPQGLKALAYQLLGIEMVSWEDTVKPASTKALQAWMEEAYGLAQESLSVEKRTEQKTLVCAACGHGRHFNKQCKACKCTECLEVVPRVKVEKVSGACEQILKHVLKHVGVAEDKESDSEYDPFKKLQEFWNEGLRGKKPSGEDLSWLVECLGPVPIVGIGHCTQDQAIRYAVGDADVTLQVAGELERRRGDARWEISEGDEDQ